MERLVRSWVGNPLLSDWTWAVTFQEYSRQQVAMFRSLLGSALIYEKSYDFREAPYLIRNVMYKALRGTVDVYCSLDDDMAFIPDMTNYASPAVKVMEKGVGVISCNWVRSMSPGFMRRAQYRDEYIKQPLVNMSGGQVYTQAIADLVQKYPIRRYMFDDLNLSLVAYLEGYENYRYLGSLAIHGILKPDGMSKLLDTVKMEIPEPEYVVTQPAKKLHKFDGNDWIMPGSEALTPLSREMHEKNRKV
jgi:hypothetical protein